MEKFKQHIPKFIIATIILLIGFWINPFGYNSPTERTIVTTQGGSQKVVFSSGIYWSGIFSHEKIWPNQISISHTDSVKPVKLQLDNDNTVEIGRIEVRFGDGPTAMLSGITQYQLPQSEKEMLEINNNHGSPEGLVIKRLAPYTKECLQSAAQLMSCEMHYSGGRAQLKQDYLDQLKNGTFVLKLEATNVYDSIERAYKKSYNVVVKTNKDGSVIRQFSSIKKYEIGVGDAQITDVDYESKVDNMLAKKIEAATAASISKQQLMTAIQQAQTAKAQGEKKLVETEYAKKVDQTNQLVAAETKVKLQEQYKFEQQEAAKASVFAAQKIRTDADADAYRNRQMVASGLTPQEKAEYEMKTKIGVAEALGKITFPATYIVGGQNGNTGSLIDAILATKLIDNK